MATEQQPKAVKLPRTAKGKKPQYFSDPAIDKLLSIVMTLAGELSVTRDRLDTVERLIETHELFDRTTIENYEPDEPAQSERDERRRRYIERVLRTVQADLDELTADDPPESVEEIMQDISEERI